MTPESSLLRIVEGSSASLQEFWNEERGLLPYSSRLYDESIVHDFEHPLAVRYTINSLLGLAEAARTPAVGVECGDVQSMTSRFLEHNADKVRGVADRGLLTLLLVEIDDERAPEWLRRLSEAFGAAPAGAMHVQDLAWCTWGACAAAAQELAGGRELALRSTRLIQTRFVDDRTGLPRHSTRRYRRGVVSFGALTYFLRAMHEASSVLGDSSAGRLFADGVRRTMELQGPRGEWPWMIDPRDGAVFDFYPVFSVHQDSMSMLFLLPALDEGHEGVEQSIRTSLAWVDGDNELHLKMYKEDPFFAFRSIERHERVPRARRYLRGLSHRVRPRVAVVGETKTRVNDECRSYHLGWILFAWSRRLERLGTEFGRPAPVEQEQAPRSES